MISAAVASVYDVYGYKFVSGDRMRYLLVALILSSAVVCSVVESPVIDAAPRSVKLYWAPAQPKMFHYSPKVVSGSGPDEFQITSWEVDRSGVFTAPYRTYSIDDVCAQLAFHVPAGGTKMRVGSTWEYDWEFRTSWTQAFKAAAITSSYKLDSLDSVYDSKRCAKITATHVLGKRKDWFVWRKLSVSTITYFDYDSHCVLGYDVELKGQLGSEKKEKSEFKCTWKLSKTVDYSEHEVMDEKVRRAISNGVKYLWTKRNTKGGWAMKSTNRGGTALAMLTLLVCGVAPDDEKIIEINDHLKSLPMEETYSVALSITAIEAMYIPDDERNAYLEGKEIKKHERALTKESRSEILRLLRWLSRAQNASNSMWHYYRDGKPNADADKFDLSNTQYALLGYAAAQRCGIPIPLRKVKALADHVMKLQQQNGPKINLLLEGKRSTKKRHRTDAPVRANSRGWRYALTATSTHETGITNAYGSMTTAGLTCLLTASKCVAGADPKKAISCFGSVGKQEKWLKNLNDSVLDGFAWLQEWFSVTCNPHRGYKWHLYYLYGLERICVMNRTRYIGGHHWYYAGAASLVSSQNADGSWTSRRTDVGAAPTCFALLFLKQGSPTSIPPERPITGK